LTLNVASNQSGNGNVWCEIYFKPLASDDPSLETNVVAAVYVNTNGNLKAYANYASSNCWVDLNKYVTTGMLWVGVAIHVDFNSKKWDVYYTTNGYGTTMSKANSTPLSIQTDALGTTSITAVVIQGGGGEIDSVAVSQGGTFVSNSPASAGNMVGMDMLGGRTNKLWGILAHHYGSGQDTLAGALGSDLKSGFAEGDKISFYYTNTWNRYRLQGGAWVDDMSGDAIPPADLHIPPGMGMRVTRSNPTNAVIFLPYDTMSNTATTIYGPNTDGGGWNLLAWPFLTSQGASSGWGFSGNAADGDMIYLDEVYNGKLWWNDYSVPKRWMQGASASTYTMTRGKAFWYYRKASTSFIWNLSP
jgi:hypothetical protein